MSLSYYNPNERYRRRFAQSMTGFAVAFAFLWAAGLAGYYLGKERGAQERSLLIRQADAVTKERDALQSEATKLKAEMRTAAARLEDMRASYQNVAPEGPAGELVRMVSKLVEEGMDPERLAFLIRANRTPRNCADPVSHRFVVATPAYSGAASEAKIAGGAIIISGSGESAQNENGKPEAWYDPAKAVSLEFRVNDGRVEKKKGIMPISHFVVLEGKEYRFTVNEGARSFAKVTFDSCEYP